jgi:BASS family bile acid:Na+ symporter
VLLVALNVRELLGVIGSGAILATLLFFTSLFALGWLLGGGHRGVLSLATTARNFGAALAPAENCFDDPSVTVMIVLGAVVCLIVSFVAAGWVRRRSPNPVLAEQCNDPALSPNQTP